MVPGQSTEDLGQLSQPMRAGEDEESSRGSRHHQLPQLPAAAGKERQRRNSSCWAAAACLREPWLRAGGKTAPAKPRGSRGTLPHFLKVREGENVGKAGKRQRES